MKYCLLVITKLRMLRNFEVMCDKFKEDRVLSKKCFRNITIIQLNSFLYVPSHEVQGQLQKQHSVDSVNCITNEQKHTSNSHKAS